MTDLASISDEDLKAMYAGVKAAASPDHDYLVRTVWGEARGEPALGQRAVAAVALNRAKASGKPVKDVVTAPGQFEPWGDPAVRAKMIKLDAASPEYQQIALNIAPSLEGDDPTAGATHFYSPSAQAALGREPPAWDNGSGYDIGHHRFLKVADEQPSAPDLSSLSDDELKALYAKAKPAAVAQPVTERPAAAPAIPMRARAPAITSATPPRKTGKASTWVDALESGVSGAADSVANVGDLILKNAIPALSPLNTGTQVAHAISGLMAGQRGGDALQVPTFHVALQPSLHVPQTTAGQYAHALGEMAPAAAAPGSIPARIANVVVPAATSETAGQIAHRMGASPLIEQIVRAGAALGGGALASTRINPSAATQSKTTLSDLQKASDEAWKAVDASGFRFPKASVQAIAKDIASTVEDAGGPELYPTAAAMANRISSLAEKGDLSVAQLNRLRSQVGTKLLQPGSTEADIGATMKDKLESLIQTADDPSLQQARDLYTRLMKTREVTNRLESADLAQETAGTGGNQNAPRQKLRPLIDPKSPQRIRNLTPDETKAIRTVTKGTAPQNLLRLLSAFDPTAGKLQAMLATGAAGLSHGTTLALMPVGMAARAGERAIADGNVEKLIQLISNGGGRRGAIPLKGPPPVPLITGGSPLSQPAIFAALLSALPSVSVAKPAQGQPAPPRR